MGKRPGNQDSSASDATRDGANRQVPFADPAALGAALLDRLNRFAALEAIAPGATADWGVQVGDKIFALTIRVVSADEMSAITVTGGGQ